MNDISYNSDYPTEQKSKNLFFSFFESINCNYYIPSVSYTISYNFGYIIMILTAIQFSSLIKFHLDKDEIIDEFQNKNIIISTFFNYPIYFFRPNLATHFYRTFEILVYVFTLILIVLIVYCFVILSFHLKNQKQTIFYIPFRILYFIFVFIQFLLFLPIILILYNSINEKSTNKDISFLKTIFNWFLIILHCVITYIIDTFNLLSSNINNNIPGFFNNITSNSLILNIFYLQILLFIETIIIDKSDIFLFLGYIGLFLCLGKIFFDLIYKSVLYNKQFILGYFIMFTFIFEQFIVSLINSTLKHKATYKTYYIGGFFTIIATYFLITKVFFYYLDKYCLFVDINTIRSFQVKSYQKNMICILYIISKRLEIRENYPNDYVSKTKELYLKLYPYYRYNFNFCLSYITFIIFSINNYELALTEIETTKKFTNLSYSEEFLLFMVKNLSNENIIRYSEIENIAQDNQENNTDYIENKSSKNNSKKWAISSILNIIKYDRLTLKFKNYIFNAIEKKRQLWGQYENDDIMIEELYESGREFFESKDKVKKIWDKLNKISNDTVNNEITKFYCDYLDKVCNDKLESEFLLDKISYTNLKYSKYNDEILKNKYKADTGVIMIEGNVAINIGRMIYINQPLIKILGYSNKSELLGNNISMIIPGDIGRYHDDIISNYFEVGKSKILKKTINFLCVKSKEKYLLPIHLLMTFMPSLDKRLRGIGIIRLRNKTDETIICSETGMIEAITPMMGKLLNITPNLIEKNNYYIQTFFPSLMKIDKSSEKKLPKFFSEELFKNTSIELESEICCPKFNLIDKNLYRIKTKNVFIQNITNDFFQDSVITSNAGDKSPEHHKILTGLFNSPIKHQKQTSNEDTLITLNFNSNNNNIINLNSVNNNNNNGNNNNSIAKNSIVDGLINQGNNVILNNNQKKKNTPDMDMIKKYKKNLLTYENQIKNELNGRENIIDKLEDIFNSMILDHELHQLTEKADINITHIGLKIYNHSIPIRIIIIQSNQLFENKKEDNLVLSVSDVNVEEKRNEMLIKEEEIERENSKGSDDLDKLYEIGSVSGKDINITLQKYLKQIKTQKYESYILTKLTGIIISIFFILSTILVIYLSDKLFSFSTNFLTLIQEAMTLNEYLLESSKYSALLYLEELFNFNSYDYFNDEILPSNLLKKVSKSFLSLLDNFFNTIKSIFDENEYMKSYSANRITYHFINQEISLSFINTFYFIIQNSHSSQRNGLKETQNNVNRIVYTHFRIIKENFMDKYKHKTNLYYYSGISILVSTICIILLLLIILFFKYRKKKNTQIKMLKVFEFLKNEEIELITKDIDSYERKYNSYFKHLDEYKKKKVQFNNKNTELLNKRLKKKFLKMQKIEESKKKYNVITGKKPENEEIENSKKHLLIKENMTLNYVASFAFIFSFVLIYTLFYLVELILYYNLIQKAVKLTLSLFTSRFGLNFLSYKINYIISSEMDLIHEKPNIYIYNNFSNNALMNFQSLSSSINKNKNMFDSNITELMSGNLCNILSNLSLCDYSLFSNIQIQGLKSLIPYYIKSLEESFLHFTNNFNEISDIKPIITNYKMCLVRFLILNIFEVYYEIFNQLNSNLHKQLNSCITRLIIICIVFGGFFLICMLIRINNFIHSVQEEEILCNQLITEIPYKLIQGNPNMKNNLAENFQLIDKY